MAILSQESDQTTPAVLALPRGFMVVMDQGGPTSNAWTAVSSRSGSRALLVCSIASCTT
jgi:hypothetical protein